MSSSLYFFIGGDKILLIEYHAKVVHVLVLMEADDDSGSLTVWTLWWRRIPLKGMNDSIWGSVIERSLHHGDLLIYSQMSVIFRGSQRSWPLARVCTRILLVFEYRLLPGLSLPLQSCLDGQVPFLIGLLHPEIQWCQLCIHFLCLYANSFTSPPRLRFFKG